MRTCSKTEALHRSCLSTQTSGWPTRLLSRGSGRAPSQMGTSFLAPSGQTGPWPTPSAMPAKQHLLHFVVDLALATAHDLHQKQLLDVARCLDQLCARRPNQLKFAVSCCSDVLWISCSSSCRAPRQSACPCSPRGRKSLPPTPSRTRSSLRWATCPPTCPCRPCTSPCTTAGCPGSRQSRRSAPPQRSPCERTDVHCCFAAKFRSPTEELALAMQQGLCQTSISPPPSTSRWCIIASSTSQHSSTGSATSLIATPCTNGRCPDTRRKRTRWEPNPKQEM